MASDVTFVTVIEAGHLELETIRLVESLRAWGGSLAEAPFLFVKPRPGPDPGRPTRRRMRELGVDYVTARAPCHYDWYNFLNKPTAVEAAANVARTPFVCWLDGDVVILDEPTLLSPGPDLDFAACASDLNLGTTGPGSRYEKYWDAYCRAVGVPLESIGQVWVHLEAVVARTYFNSGVFSFRTSTGYSGAYLRTVLAALDAKITSSTDGIFMHEQMACGIAARKMGLRVRELPWSYNFFIGEFERTTSPAAREAVAGMAVLHYHDAFFPERFEWLCGKMAEFRPDRLDDIRALGPLQMSRINPWARLRTRFAKRSRKPRNDRYLGGCSVIETPPVDRAVAAGV